MCACAHARPKPPLAPASVFQGAGLLPRDISDIQSGLGKCACEHGKFLDRAEPYDSLAKGMPKDDANLTRREIAAQGVGLLLHDLVAIQAQLGPCKCRARG